MAPIEQATCRNRLLAKMHPADFALLPLESVGLTLRQTLIAPGEPVSHLFFLESGLASATTGEAAGQVEVWMIGREGVVGVPPHLLGGGTLPLSCFVQMEGAAFRVPAPDLSDAADRSASLRSLLLAYVQSLLVQGASTSFSNAAFTIGTRLARWLLMVHDRADGDEILVTHDFLSTMLGVRRPGVTVAIQELEGHGLIKATRGRIHIQDRAGLLALAGASYGMAEAEYGRIFGHG